MSWTGAGVSIGGLICNLQKDDARVLDVGCGSGYLVATMARLNVKAKVYGVDYIPELTRLSLENIRKADGDLLDSGRIEIHTGDGWKGYKPGAPYDVIHVGAAAATVPSKLLRQLKVGGAMLIPIGPEGHVQTLTKINRVKQDGPIKEAFVFKQLFAVRFVPLVKIRKEE